MSEFSQSQKKWIYVELLNSAVSIISGIFVSLFIWQTTNEISKIIYYHIVLFSFLPFATVISSIISQKYSLKISTSLSFLFRIMLLSILILFSDSVSENIMLLSIFSSLSIGFYSIPSNTIFQIIYQEHIRNKALGYLGIGRNFISLTLPLLGALIIAQFSYIPLFAITIGLLVISLYLTLSLTIEKTSIVWEMYPIKSIFYENDFRKLMISKLFFGMRNGIMWSMFGIIVLFVLNDDIELWGTINSGIYLGGILSNYLFSKYVSQKFDIVTLIFSTFTYTTASIVLAVNYGLYALIIFSLIHTISGGFLSASSWSLGVNILNQGTNKTHITQYYSLLEIPTAIGRITPLLLIMLIIKDFGNTLTISSLFLFVGFVPIIEATLLQKTLVFNKQLKLLGFNEYQ